MPTAQSPRSSRSGSWAPSNPATAPGAVLPEKTSTVGSSRTICGASTPTKRSNNRACSRGARSSGRSASALLPPQPHHDVDAGDLVTFRGRRRLADHDIVRRNIEQIVLVLDEEVMVLGIVGVEIGLGAVDRDLAQQADFGELVQRVVDG